MLAQTRIVILGLFVVAVASCGVDRSGQDFGDDVYDALATKDVDRVASQAGSTLSEGQRQAISDVMARCSAVDGTTQVIDGGVAATAKFVAFELDCSGTRSVFVARVYLEDETWTVDARDLPGGGSEAKGYPDLGPLEGLPRAW